LLAVSSTYYTQGWGWAYTGRAKFPALPYIYTHVCVCVRASRVHVQCRRYALVQSVFSVKRLSSDCGSWFIWFSRIGIRPVRRTVSGIRDDRVYQLCGPSRADVDLSVWPAHACAAVAGQRLSIFRNTYAIRLGRSFLTQRSEPRYIVMAIVIIRSKTIVIYTFNKICYARFVRNTRAFNIMFVFDFSAPRVKAFRTPESYFFLRDYKNALRKNVYWIFTFIFLYIFFS